MIYLLAPTARVEKCAATLSKWVSMADRQVRILSAVDTLDEKRKLLLACEARNIHCSVYVTNPQRKGVTYPLYCLTSTLKYWGLSPTDIIIAVSDDFLPNNKGWDTELLAHFENFSGVLVQDDTYQRLKTNEVITIPILTYEALQKLNYITYHPAYLHMFSDMEFYYVARDAGLLKDIRGDYPSIFAHHHWVNPNHCRLRDAVDAALNDQTSWNMGQHIFNIRQHHTLAQRLASPYRYRVCFSLWGTDPMYHIGAIKNIKQYAELLPEFTCRFYIESTLDEKYSNDLREAAASVNKEVEIIKIDKTDENSGMFWRFDGLEDETTLVFLSRDTDSRLTKREAAAVRKWLKSDCSVHIMRDHPYHTVPILGGLWGSRFKNMKGIMDLSKNYTQEKKGCDQDFLAKEIYPRFKNDCYVHDNITCLKEKWAHPFPTPREITSLGTPEYVGDVYNIDDMPHQSFGNVLAVHIPPVPTESLSLTQNIFNELSEKQGR